ncbi:formylglycine-generating enzyme family protein, partial [Desulfobacterota bacterium M19]
IRDSGPEPPEKLLEVLSKYMEPEETESQEALTESEEGLVARLLARFTPKFIKIAAGVYSLGTAAPEQDEHSLEQRQLNSFYMGQYPVTNDIFELFIRETGYRTEAEIAGYSQVHRARCVVTTNPATGRQSISISRGGGGSQIEGADWRHPEGRDSSIVNRGNHPVVQVSRHDAMAFAAWAGKRLPSEAEWEAAARGLNSCRPFPWGRNWAPEQANTAASYIGGTTAVDAHPGNISPTGIHDLLGNVYEWTSPAGQSTGDNIKYILKGGCWNSNHIISISHRLTARNSASNTIGFRCLAESQERKT